MVIIDHISIWRCRKYPMESPSVYCERNDIKEAFNIASMCCTGCAMQCYKAFYYISKCVCECMEWLGTVSKRCAFSSIFLFAFIFCAHFFWTFCCTRRKKWIQLITFAECVTCHITVLAKYVFSIETIFNFVYSLHSWPQQNLCEHDNNLLANLLISYAYECHAQGFADVTRDSEKLPSFITHTKFNNRYECRLLIIMYTARSCVYILYINMYICMFCSPCVPKVFENLNFFNLELIHTYNLYILANLPFFIKFPHEFQNSVISFHPLTRG